MPFYDFEAIKASTDILKVAEDLQLTLKKSGAGYRCACPACGANNERGLVITPGKGYYCFAQMKGGDVIALVGHTLNIGTKEAAGWLQEMYFTGEGTRTVQSQEAGQVPTVPPKKESREKPAASFNPNAYLAKLRYSDEIAALGISQQDAEAIGIGWSNSGMHKGIAFALRYDTGEIAGFCSVIGGEVKLPKQLLPRTVHVLKRSA
ncbi:CHC2 zinc finger domain-containing protein [Bradyrhizobium guangzhouense]|nr:CHC2 zinc finger domain-containing protein [Bradyrhizobium guangzhouense]